MLISCLAVIRCIRYLSVANKKKAASFCVAHCDQIKVTVSIKMASNIIFDYMFGLISTHSVL